jgi:hypothetical protein
VNQPRKHVLANSALARDQYRDVAHRDTAGYAHGVFHRATRPDHCRRERIAVGEREIYSLQFRVRDHSSRFPR